MNGGRNPEEERGGEARPPDDIARAGWLDTLLRTKNEMRDDHVSMTAAGVAFYALLAIFPGIVAAISLWALASDPHQIQHQIHQIAAVLPGQAAGIVEGQARKVALGPTKGVTIAGIGGILLALYSASKGAKALIEGLNIVYDEDESRGFIKLNTVAIALTAFLIIGLIVSIVAVMVLPAILGIVGLGGLGRGLVTYLRWPILLVLAVIGLGVVYRFGPSRDRPRWRWLSWGAALATVVWIGGSILFSVYVSNFGSYNETYGTLGAVVILLLWLWLSAYAVLLGAELNSELEHRTRKGAARDEPHAIGKRGAHVADAVGERR